MKNLFVVLGLLFATLLTAQSTMHQQAHSHDVGVVLGGSYYIGDLNPRRHFFLTQPAVGAFYRYNYDYRIAFRGGFNFGSIQGDDSQSNDADQLERNLNFKSNIYELNAQAEFNFWEYQIGHSKYLFAPYVFLGLDVFMFKPLANYQDKWVELKPLSTEGQKTSQNPGKKQYYLIQPSIPFGLGFKLSLANQVGLGFEWGPRKAFTDYLDDVSGKYVDPRQLAKDKGPTAALLSDRSLDPQDFVRNYGKMRGNPVTKDWYFFYGFTLNIKLKFRPKCATFKK